MFSVLVAVLCFRQILSSSSTVAEYRWCCISDAEMSKCQHLANVTSQIAWNIRITCVHGGNVTNCIRMVGNGIADVITLGEEQIYQAGVQHGLVPVVAEDYGKHEEGLSSYAVALIKTNLSKEISLKSLKGRKSCHPAAGDSVGWTAPVGLLIEIEAMQWKECNPYQSVGEYFQQSCVPGALSKKYNPEDTNPISLCAICFNQKTCPSNVSERYFGYQGAYRCLTEGAGDVAFVSHLTVFDFTGTDNDLNPGKDFNLLCPDGTRADVGDFEKCNLARIPSRVVMSRPGNKLDGLKQSLLRLDELLRSKSPSFQMFNSSAYGGKDLLFKDFSVRLIDVKEKNSTEAWLGQKYFKALRSLSHCPEVVAAPRSLAVKLISMNTVQLLLLELLTVVCFLFRMPYD